MITNLRKSPNEIQNAKNQLIDYLMTLKIVSSFDFIYEKFTEMFIALHFKCNIENELLIQICNDESIKGNIEIVNKYGKISFVVKKLNIIVLE